MYSLLRDYAQPEQDATALLMCIAVAEAAGSTVRMASLQVDFVVLHADHPAAADVERDLLANPDKCKVIDRARTQTPLAVLPTYSYDCAVSAEQNGDISAAISLFELFVEIAPTDDRFGAAHDSLARLLIARARGGGAREISPLRSTGASGSGVTVLVVSNDTDQPLRVVISGPESRIEIIPATPNFTLYTELGARYACPSGVPTVTFELQAGMYDVLFESMGGRAEEFVGTYDMRAGRQYEECFFVVQT